MINDSGCPASWRHRLFQAAARAGTGGMFLLMVLGVGILDDRHEAAPRLKFMVIGLANALGMVGSLATYVS